MAPQRSLTLLLRLVLCLFCLTAAAPLYAESEHCDICGAELTDVAYTTIDQVTHQRVKLCPTCAACPDVCFICGLPVRKNPLKLADGRVLCERDAQSAVLNDQDGVRICSEVRDRLDRLFSRFMEFPEKNVDVAVIDRISLLGFKMPGNDVDCPNLLGYLRPQIDRGQVRYAMRIMSALPRAQFESTCAHEYTHAWVFENLSPERIKTLGHDSHEAFCELVAYLLMDSENETAEKARILANAYTRGQIQVFLDAEKRYGFNDVVDWMKFGVDSDLKANGPGQVHDVAEPQSTNAMRTNWILPGSATQRVPDRLVLRGVSLERREPLAFINDSALTVGETAAVQVGTSNVTVQCLTITADTVRVRITDAGQERELHLTDRK